jgi:nucleotide-binding universal stress UspA family protein
MSFVTSALELRSVLIATDFSQASEKPLRHAVAIARRYGAKFFLSHVVSSLGLSMAGPDAIAASEAAVLRDATRLEDDLVRNGPLAGLQHQFVIRQGEVWPELEAIIREEKIDLVIIGTHGRHGVGKLLLGSVAEQIFRHADCLVMTVGPSSYQEARVDTFRANRVFLFATDFGEASLHALPYAISSANQYGAKLVLLNVIPAVPMPEGFHWGTASDLIEMRENARMASLRRLQELTRNATLEVRPEFVAEFGTAIPVSDKILETAEKLTVDVVIMGLHRSTHIGTVSHMPWATAYEVVCHAGCPVLTVRK